MIYIILFLLSFGLTYFIKNHAIENSLFADMNERSSHMIPTPQGGGIAIAITWFVGICYLYLTDNINTSLYYALISGVGIAILGYFDDLYELSAKLRLSVQSIIALSGLVALGGIESIDIWIFTLENKIITNLFAFFILLWFINLYNFLDGIDGYAGSEAIFLSMAGFILFGGSHFIVLAAAVLGFLIWNWHKAKIFMGDVGSTLIGYNIAIFTIYYTNQEASNLWIWIILFGVFWFDATLTLFRRYQNRERLSQGHKKHAYQRLTQVGWTHSRVVLSAIFINIILLGLVFFISNLFIALILAILLLYTMVNYVDKKKSFN